MAEEIANSIATCEKSESDVSNSGESSITKPISRDSEGAITPTSDRTFSDACHDFTDSRRHSTGSPSSHINNKKIVPNYLRASTGSCHDFCKYGHKHASEEKETYPIRKRLTRTLSEKMEKERYPMEKKIVRTSSEKHKSTVIVSLRERKKATVLELMVSPNMKSHSLKHRALPGAISLEDPPEIIKKLPSKKVKVSPKRDALSPNKMSKAEKRTNDFSNKHSSSLHPPLTKQVSSFQTVKSAKNVEKAEQTTSNLSWKSSPSVVPQPSAEKAGKVKGKNNLSQKSSPSVGQQRAVPKSSSPFRTPQSMNGRGKIKDDIQASRNMVVTKASAKKVFASHTALLSPKLSMNRNVTTRGKKNISLEVVSSPKDQNRIQNEGMEKTDGENAPEKTLHVIVETKNNVVECSEDGDIVSSLAPHLVQSPNFSSQLLSPSLSSHEERKGEEQDDDPDGEEQEGEVDLEVYDEEEEVKDENGYAFEIKGEFSNKNGKANSDDVEEEEEAEGQGGGEGELEVEEGELEVYDDVDDDEEEGETENGYTCDATGEISNENGMANKNDVAALKGNLRKALQKGVVLSESKDPRPVKLKFKRGKVVDLQSEDNVPSRLQFCRRRKMEENHDQKGEIRMKIFKKKGPYGDVNGTNPSNKKVVLRHQDTEGRKDVQGLLNNVIEETASKLVESRKSKVKALVGAFETVISLRDAKPSSQTVS